MGFVMTKQNDEVDVDIEIDGSTITLTVGTIPNEIGDKINQFSLGGLEALRAQQAGDQAKAAELVMKNSEGNNEAVRLLLKYGIRNHKGLEYSDGADVPCVTEVEKDTGYTVLSEKTLKLYLLNTQFLITSSGCINALRVDGIGKYKKGGYKTLAESKEGSTVTPLESASAQ